MISSCSKPSEVTLFLFVTNQDSWVQGVINWIRCVDFFYKLINICPKAFKQIQAIIHS